MSSPGAANIGFVCVPSYNAAFNWDDKSIRPFCQDVETDQMDAPDHWDSVENNLKKENYARQHFVSLLNYLSDQKQFLEMIAGDDYSPEALKEMASYVKKNGLKIYGFTTIAR
ncbi:MAG: anti sigma factor C-terminal domain-containing protein [Anaerobutyricum sp.]